MYMQSTLIKMYMQCTFNNNVSHIVHFDFFHCTSKVGTNVHQMQFSDRSHVHFLVMYMRCTCECNFLLADTRGSLGAKKKKSGTAGYCGTAYTVPGQGNHNVCAGCRLHPIMKGFCAFEM
jgi:hypothetical protein